MGRSREGSGGNATRASTREVDTHTKKDAQSDNTSSGHVHEQLHRQFGNQAIQRLVQNTEDSALQIASPASQHEREATRVEETASRSADAASTGETNTRTDIVHRKSASPSTTDAVVPGTGQLIDSLGAGMRLSNSQLKAFEPRFGHDLSDVRIHTSPNADAAARMLGAEAFTLGSDIGFQQGTYRPNSTDGRALLAHELTHVVQGSSAGATVVHRRVDPTALHIDRGFDDTAPGDALDTETVRRLLAHLELERRVQDAFETAETEAETQRAEGIAKGVVEDAEMASDLPARVREAVEQVTTEWLDEHVPAVYHAQPNAGMDTWIDELWGRLGLMGIPRSSSDEELSEALQALHLEGQVSDALVRRFRSISSAGDGFASDVAAFFRKNEVAVGSVEQLAGVVWRDHLRCGTIDVLPEQAQDVARNARNTIVSGVAQGYEAWASESTGDEALETVTAEEREAAMEALRAREGWLEGPGDLAAFMDDVAIALGLHIHESDEDAIARDSMNDRAGTLLAVGEVGLLREALPSHWLDDLSPSVWLEARPTYVGTFEVPVWTFYDEYVDGFTFMGHTIDKQHGMHREIVPMLDAIEATMLDERGEGDDRIEDIEFRPRFYGFRFTPKNPGPGDSVSYHGTARAFDMQAQENPYVGSDALTLASVVSGTWLHELSQSRDELRGLAEEQRPMLDQQREVQGDERAEVERDLEAVQYGERAERLVTEASEIRSGLLAAELALVRNWPEFEEGVLFSTFVNQFSELLRELGAEEDLPTMEPVIHFDALRDRVITQLEHERAAAEDAEGWREQRKYTRRINRLESLKNELDKPDDREKLIRRSSNASAGVAELARGGFTNQPDWMIRAFVRHGWSWGGSWRSVKDAMHFDYLGPLEGIR